ncbi:iron(III) transport system permease protein [Prauserella marina]|uniref:Iron(III) transport system permease protein n=2 Tax=Prauserella marina TaxID=530584 RepID=A0A1G6IZC8_9PSEU|nr:iron(III) transport system permease protein [Prauserella marina]SDC11146.1 iron(III) transport system permease protein [Prauserella marina]
MLTMSEAPPVRGRRFTVEKGLPVLWCVGAFFLVAVPVGGLVWRSLQIGDTGVLGLGNYSAALAEPGIIEAIFNSLWIGLATTAGALLIAVPFAFFVSRTDMPARKFFRSVAVLTFAAPGFIAAMGWILLLGPRNGLLNQYVLTPLGLPAFNIFGPQGIVLVLSFFLYPLIFLPVTDALDNMDSRLEEAAASLGAGRWHTLRRIVLPLILPPVFSGSLLVFISAFVIFGPVALLGGPVGFQTIPTAMLQLMSFPPRIEYAAVLALPVLVVLGGLLVLQRRLYGRRRYTTVGGKPGQQRRIQLGRWRWLAFLGGFAVIMISVVLPFGVLLLTSFRKAIGLPLSWDNLVLFDNYRALFDQPEIMLSFWNSLWISVVATVGSIVFAVLAAWLVSRARSRFTGVIQPAMLAPLAFPGAILGIAMIIAFSGQPFWIGGTVAIMLLAYLIRVVPQSFTYIHAGFAQLGGETEEAARSLGASWSETMRRVTVPLLRGPILSVAVLNFVLLFRELDISIFLYTGTNSVAPVVLYNLAAESRFQLMGALSVVVLAVNLGIVLLARRFLGVKLSH